MGRHCLQTVKRRHIYVPVLARSQALKAEHPFWGYRRICGLWMGS
jgi:hypothetical protein